LTRLLAIDTSSAWCSVALLLDDSQPVLLHQKVSAGSSQLLLPWVDTLLQTAQVKLASLDAIAVGVGPGAFTGVRLGVAVTQGLAVSVNLPVIPVISLDAIAAELIQTPRFMEAKPRRFIVAIDARMGEVYWAHYQSAPFGLPKRNGDIHLSTPEDVDLEGIDFIAGSAIDEYGERLLGHAKTSFPTAAIDSQINISASGILSYAKVAWSAGLTQDVHQLEPVYVRNKVAYTAYERKQANS